MVTLAPGSVAYPSPSPRGGEGGRRPGEGSTPATIRATQMSPNQKRDRARQLRRDQTETEAFVWARLRGRRFAGFKFRRQHPIGNYFVDFVCLARRLVIELDGEQ